MLLTWDRLCVVPPPEAQDRMWCDIKLTDTVICNEKYMYINFQLDNSRAFQDIRMK